MFAYTLDPRINLNENRDMITNHFRKKNHGRNLLVLFFIISLYFVISRRLHQGILVLNADIKIKNRVRCLT